MTNLNKITTTLAKIVNRKYKTKNSFKIFIKTSK